MGKAADKFFAWVQDAEGLDEIPEMIDSLDDANEEFTEEDWKAAFGKAYKKLLAKSKNQREPVKIRAAISVLTLKKVHTRDGVEFVSHPFRTKEEHAEIVEKMRNQDFCRKFPERPIRGDYTEDVEVEKCRIFIAGVIREANSPKKKMSQKHA